MFSQENTQQRGVKGTAATAPFATNQNEREWGDALGPAHHRVIKNTDVTAKAGTQRFDESVYLESLIGTHLSGPHEDTLSFNGDVMACKDELEVDPQEGPHRCMLKPAPKEVTGKVSGVGHDSVAFQSARLAHMDIQRVMNQKRMAALPALGGAPYAVYGSSCVPEGEAQAAQGTRVLKKAPKEVTGKVGVENRLIPPLKEVTPKIGSEVHARIIEKEIAEKVGSDNPGILRGTSAAQGMHSSGTSPQPTRHGASQRAVRDNGDILAFSSGPSGPRR